MIKYQQLYTMVRLIDGFHLPFYTLLLEHWCILPFRREHILAQEPFHTSAQEPFDRTLWESERIKKLLRRLLKYFSVYVLILVHQQKCISPVCSCILESACTAPWVLFHTLGWVLACTVHRRSVGSWARPPVDTRYAELTDSRDHPPHRIGPENRWSKPGRSEVVKYQKESL